MVLYAKKIEPMNAFPEQDLQLFGTFDRGIPNKEHIAFRASRPVDLTYYGVVLSVRLASGAGVPVRDNFFWFGPGIINGGDWIYLYTCSGRPTSTPIPNSTNKVYMFFWTRANVLFHNPDLVPLLFKFDAVTIGEPPVAALPR